MLLEGRERGTRQCAMTLTASSRVKIMVKAVFRSSRRCESTHFRHGAGGLENNRGRGKGWAAIKLLCLLRQALLMRGSHDVKFFICSFRTIARAVREPPRRDSRPISLLSGLRNRVSRGEDLALVVERSVRVEECIIKLCPSNVDNEILCSAARGVKLYRWRRAVVQAFDFKPIIAAEKFILQLRTKK